MESSRKGKDDEGISLGNSKTNEVDQSTGLEKMIAKQRDYKEQELPEQIAYRAAMEKRKAEKELLDQAAEKRLDEAVMPSNEDVDGIFEELSAHFSEGGTNENVWRMLNFPFLADFKCRKGDKNKCGHCKDAMPTDGLQRYCKHKALEFVDTCLDHDELKKVHMCHGFKYCLHSKDDSDDDSDDDEPSDKLEIFPIGENKDQYHIEDEVVDENCNTIHSFLSRSGVFDSILAAKLLSAFPADGTPAVLIEYSIDNLYSCWDDGYFWPRLILLITDDLAVAYARMGFQYEWDDSSF